MDIFKYELYDGDECERRHCVITGSLSTSCETIVIPDRIEGYGVTEIGENAFADLKSLKTLDLSDAPIESIGERAFADCSDLSSVLFGKSIKSIGSNAFIGCDALKDVSVSDLRQWCGIQFANRYSNPLVYAKTLLIDGKKTETLELPQRVGKINSYAFVCSSVRSIVMPDSVFEVCSHAFSDCAELRSVVLSDGLARLSRDAFLGCVNLEFNEYDGCKYLGSATNKYYALVGYAYERTSYRTAPETRLIADNAFQDNGAVCSVSLEQSLTAIGRFAFQGCGSLTSIDVPPSLLYVADRAFLGTNIKRVNIRDISSWLKICFEREASNPTSGADLYLNGERLTELTVPSDTEELPQRCFDGCASLEKVTVPDGVKKIYENAFAECRKLKEINLSENIDYIDRYAFKNCVSLKRIDLPKVYSTGFDVFDGCSKLEQVTFKDETELIDDCAFGNCVSLKEIVLPPNLKRIGNKAFSSCASLGRVVFPEGLTDVGAQSFFGCSSLRSVKLPESVSWIGEGAFENCAELKNLEVPDSLRVLGKDVIKGCPKVTVSANGKITDALLSLKRALL